MAIQKYLVQNYPEIFGLRLDKALSHFAEVTTRSRAEFLLGEQRVKVDSHFEKNSYKIKGNESIEIHFPDEVSIELQPYDFPLDIVYEDSDLLVVNKPAGLVVHPGAGHQQETLVNALMAHTTDLSMKFSEQRPGIVHRIDKETSGLIVVAKNDFTHEHLSQQFKNKTVRRLYHGVTWGCPKPDHGQIKSFLGRHPKDRQRFSSQRNRMNVLVRERGPQEPAGKWAVTNYEIIRNHGPFALVQFKLETGRTHQIRVHISELGHPLVGDSTYGSDAWLRLLTQKEIVKVIDGLGRFLLHAAELGFQHPRSLQNLLFKTPWPEKDLQVLNSWGLLS